MTKESRIEMLFQASIETKQASLEKVKTDIADAADKLIQVFQNQGHILHHFQ